MIAGWKGPARSGDQIVAGQSVFRVRVGGVPTHDGEVP